MSERFIAALDAVRSHAGAAVAFLAERTPGQDAAFVLASSPRGVVPDGAAVPPRAPGPAALLSDPARLAPLLPVALRLALPAPASHAWVQDLADSALTLTLAWTQPPAPGVLEELEAAMVEQLGSLALDFTLRRQLALDNTRLRGVLGLLDQAVVTIDAVRQEASVNRAAAHLLGLAPGAVPATMIAEALRRLQGAALDQAAVAAVAGRLARDPAATVTGVTWAFARPPTHLRVTTAPLDGDGAIGRVWVFDDISAQMRALEAAEQARADYRLLAENADDLVFRESTQRTLEWVSDSVETTLGWRVGAMLGRPIADFMHPDDAASMARAIRDPAGAAERQRYRARFAREDGSYRWFEVSLRTVLDEAGRVTAWVGSGRDVQAQVEAQQALAVSEARLRASVDGMLDPQVLLAPVRDATGTVIDFFYLDVNRATCEYLGLAREALVGTSLLGAMPRVRESGLFALYAAAMERDAPVVLDDFLYENEVLGLVRRYDIRAARTGDELTLTWRDTTERFEAQARVAQSEQYFRLLAENSTNVVTLVRDAGFDWVSPSLTRTLGWSPAQWMGRGYLEFLHPDDHRAARDALAAIRASGARVLRLRVRAASGRYHWAEVHADAYFGPDGRRDGIVASFRTIDAEVAAEAAVARLARFDTLTGLANRGEALERFAERQSLERRPGGGSAVLFCDVDRFKSINDGFGHAAGDQVLRVLAERIRGCVRGEDICARMGGDELLVILDGIHALDEASAIAEKIRRAAAEPIAAGEATIETSLSIGVALVRPGEAFDQVMARADGAMYEAKTNGRNQVVRVG